ncbi:hypothetical protein M8C21_026457 [Ambrosia artemisiifolia]|uniref:Peptidase S8/S53 domain-containing protein n=1 Tax=Ambrosia artemisiifolia TaxID=4212 RepID=A0AAD5BVS9_AMBAR|nr:hypothetical protein M8C21_026457 [Ambrosia artemisiifolia]
MLMISIRNQTIKPDIVVPGSLIWASRSPNGTDEANYEGENFAMISGTSMATPHITGIATLIKQKHPHWSPVKRGELRLSRHFENEGTDRVAWDRNPVLFNPAMDIFNKHSKGVVLIIYVFFPAAADCSFATATQLLRTDAAVRRCCCLGLVLLWWLLITIS